MSRTKADEEELTFRRQNAPTLAAAKAVSASDNVGYDAGSSASFATLVVNTLCKTRKVALDASLHSAIYTIKPPGADTIIVVTQQNRLLAFYNPLARLRTLVGSMEAAALIPAIMAQPRAWREAQSRAFVSGLWIPAGAGDMTTFVVDDYRGSVRVSAELKKLKPLPVSGLRVRS